MIGIAHPYEISISFLKKKLANLPDDVELITVSEFLSLGGEDITDSFEQPRLANKSIQTTTDTAPE